MNRENRRAAVAAYKERKPAAGVYAVRCTATGQCWIGSTRDFGAVKNRHWFGLRQGDHPRRGLQAAWREHGEDGFVFERIETFSEDQKDWERDRALEDRLAFWQAELKAETL